jgi:hypothetical protein
MIMTNPILVLFLLFCGLIPGAGSDFDRMKSLAGKWEATHPEGKSTFTYQLVSNGNALLESMQTGNETMMSVYHPDGDSVLMTHYCAIGNQPRMRAQKSTTGDAITFKFVDVSNAKDTQPGHMSELVIKFKDADHVVQEWTFSNKGQDSTTTFNLTRVK